MGHVKDKKMVLVIARAWAVQPVQAVKHSPTLVITESSAAAVSVEDVRLDIRVVRSCFRAQRSTDPVRGKYRSSQGRSSHGRSSQGRSMCSICVIWIVQM
ncbi:hypothetical protein ACOMHN_009054 [Nucella lapillus]